MKRIILALLEFTVAFVVTLGAMTWAGGCSTQPPPVSVPEAGGTGWFKVAVGDQLLDLAVEELSLDLGDHPDGRAHCTIVTVIVEMKISAGTLTATKHGGLPPPLSDERCFTEGGIVPLDWEEPPIIGARPPTEPPSTASPPSSQEPPES